MRHLAGAQSVLASANVPIPSTILLMTPYIATIIAPRAGGRRCTRAEDAA
jgi:ABC-type uncharacterized transport system permease subunit